MKTNDNKKPKTTYFLAKSFTAKKAYLGMILKILRIIIEKEKMMFIGIISYKENPYGEERIKEDYLYPGGDILQTVEILNDQATKMISEDAEAYVNITGRSITDPDITKASQYKITYEGIAKED